MEAYLNEVKALLRSILISTPVLIDVVQLNKDFIAQEGIEIPFQKFGYNSLVDFLKSIPDVLLVKGDSRYSEVYPVASEKSLHVNNLVMKQKLSSKPGSFTSKRRRGRINNRRTGSCFTPPSQKQTHQTSNVTVKPDDVLTSQLSYSDKSITAKEKSTNEKTTSPVHRTESKNEVVNISPKCNSYWENTIKNIKRLQCPYKAEENISTNACRIDPSGSTKFLRRIEYKENSPNKQKTQNSESLQLDLSLKGCGKIDEPLFWKGGTLKKSRNKKSENFDEHCSEVDYSSDKYIRSSGSTASGYLTKNSAYDLMYNSQKTKPKNIQNTSYTSKSKLKSSVLTKIKDNLRRLISDFPDGIWCAELPVIYKKFIGEELCFEDYGYRCLIYLCFDLEDVFHCVKESSCDYKLYDARKPSPKVDFVPEPKKEEPANFSNPAFPDMSWGTFDSFLPPNAIKLGFKSKRIQVADVFEVGTSVSVTVAEIYDISKFWIVPDDSKLDSLMNEMQIFYEENDKKYLVPRSLLEETLHCVVLFHNKFHRAVILNTMPDEEYMKVYYFDYGTLGKVSKSEVWFLTEEFAELPCQAVRARLADVYPPYEGVTWSPFANYDFCNMASMKKLTAVIVRTDKLKNLVDIKLQNANSYISDVLVERNHAIFINKPQKTHIEDPHCKSRVRFVHLFPTFDEIENWVVPSMEEAGDFLETTVTADFLYSQYFSRVVDGDLIDSIESKMKILCKKKKSLIKHLKPSDELNRHSMEEMSQIAYGALYQPLQPETTSENYQQSFEEQQNELSRSVRIMDIENDELLLGILRQARLNKSLSFQDAECGEDPKTPKTSIFKKEQECKSIGSSKMVDQCNKTSNKKFKKFSSFTELENYLSDEDSSKTSKKSTPTLIDLEDDIHPIVPSTNLLADKEFENSLATLAKHRQMNQQCLLTDSNLYDAENLVNPLDLPIPEYVPVNSFPDLIQFDKEVSELSDADDEDSGSDKFSHQTNNSSRKKKKNCESTKASDSYLSTNTQNKPSIFAEKNEFTSKTENENSCITNFVNRSMRCKQDEFPSFNTKESSYFSPRNIEKLNNSNCNFKIVEGNDKLQGKSDIRQVGIEEQFSVTLNMTGSNDHRTQKTEVGTNKNLRSDVISPSSTNESIITINSSEIERSRPTSSLNDFYNNILQQSSANNKYYSYESNVSSLENVPDYPSFTYNSDSVIASTPFSSGTASSKDKSFLEEFDILNLPPIASSVSDVTSETLTKLSFASGECMSLETQDSENDQVSNIIEYSGPEVLKTNTVENNREMLKNAALLNGVGNVESQTTVPDSNNSSFSIHAPPFFPSNLMQQAFGAAQNVVQPSNNTMVRGPPPGFPPLPGYGQRPGLFPQSESNLTVWPVPDYPSFTYNSDSVIASTPFSSGTASSKDKSFLEEFDILNLPPIASSMSDVTSETLTKLSFASGECMSLETQNSENDQVSNIIEYSGPEVLKTNNVENNREILNGVGNVESQTTVPNSNASSFSIHAPPFIPSNPMQQAFGVAENVMQPSNNMKVRGPPPGFPPLPGYGQRPMLFPQRYGFQVPQQVMNVNGAQNYTNYPIVFINYNFLPPMNNN